MQNYRKVFVNLINMMKKKSQIPSYLWAYLKVRWFQNNKTEERERTRMKILEKRQVVSPKRVCEPPARQMKCEVHQIPAGAWPMTLWRGKRSIIESLDCTVTSDTALILLSSFALFLISLIFSFRILQYTCYPTLSWLQAISLRPITDTTMSKHAWKHMHTH